ncbi:MAG: alpha/beta fold hydrolase [Acidimicrobiales bacterium]|nr:alpha/beta fold hydrolase [Acidimicrobiales bacterium]
MNDRRLLRGDRIEGRPLVVVQSYPPEQSNAERLRALLPGRAVHPLVAPSMTDSTMLTRAVDWVRVHRTALDADGVEPPYLLLGWSFGGVLALELARELVAQGRPVAYLGLLDTVRPELRPLRLRDAVPYHLAEAGLLEPSERRDYLVSTAKIRAHRRLRSTTARVARRVAPGRRRAADPAPRPAHPNVRSVRRSYLNDAGMPIDVPAVLYTTRASVDRCGGDPSLRWAPFLRGGFEVVPVPGNHHSLWEPPNLEVVAGEIARSLRHVDGLRDRDGDDVAVPVRDPDRLIRRG